MVDTIGLERTVWLCLVIARETRVDKARVNNDRSGLVDWKKLIAVFVGERVQVW